MYNPYVSFPENGTEVFYSETHDDGSVEVWVETLSGDGLKSAHCFIPAFYWDEINGYASDEMADISGFVRDNFPLIMEMSREMTFAQSKMAT